MEDPVCSGTGDTVKQASYLIKEAVPTIKFSGTVYNDKNGNDALDEQENWTSVEPWPRTSTSTSCARTKSCRRRRWRPARAAISSPRPAIRTTPSSCRTPRQSLSHAPGLLAFQEPGVRHSRPLFRRPGHTGLRPDARHRGLAVQGVRPDPHPAARQGEGHLQAEEQQQRPGSARWPCFHRSAARGPGDRWTTPGRAMRRHRDGIHPERPLAPALCRRQPAQGRQQLRRDRDRAGPDPGTENQ